MSWLLFKALNQAVDFFILNGDVKFLLKGLEVIKIAKDLVLSLHMGTVYFMPKHFWSGSSKIIIIMKIDECKALIV